MHGGYKKARKEFAFILPPLSFCHKMNCLKNTFYSLRVQNDPIFVTFTLTGIPGSPDSVFELVLYSKMTVNLVYLERMLCFSYICYKYCVTSDDLNIYSRYTRSTKCVLNRLCKNGCQFIIRLYAFKLSTQKRG